MSKFSFRRERRQEFKHIAHGLIPAASIAPKPAVPRTPPPRSPDPSPERPRSALAAAILSSSLTGQTWAIPLARPRTFSESEQSESLISEPNINKELYTRDRWSDDLASRPRLSSPDHSEEELEDKEEEIESEEDREDHIYQTLDRGETRSITEAVYALPLKPQTRTPQPTLMSGSRVPSPDFSEETSIQTPEANSDSSKKKASVRKSSGTQNEDAPSVPPILTTDRPSQASQPKNPQNPIPPSPESSKAYIKVQKEVVQTLPAKARMADDQKLLEERLQRLEQEISHSQASSNLRSSAGSQAELQNLRRHAQELVDENDALKLTVHRLNVELNRYQTRFRPLSKQESSKISGLPKTGSPPPWLLDMKYLSPLMLAYEDRINEKDALLQTTEEDVKRLRLHVEEVIEENERLHDVIAKTGGVSQKDCHQLQQQAFLVLQENQVLIDQLKAQHVKAKANYSRHHSEVSKVTKQLMLLEAQKQRLQEDLEESRRQMQENMREVKVLQARLKDAVTWDEHCNIVGKLRGQLEQQEKRNKSRMDELLLRVSNLQEESRRLALDKANLTADIKRMEAELELTRQANRKAERRMSVLKRQREKCVLKEEKTRHYLGAIISVAELISQERDQLLHMSDEGQTSELHNLALVGKTKHLLEPDLGGELTSECLVTKSWPERPSKAQLDYIEPPPCGLINCRDRHQASVFQHEKQGFLSRILHGTVRFGKLQEEVKVYRRQASTRLAVLEEAAEGRTASYQREILHLQRLLRERQEAEERLLQSKRDIEEELEVVWQAATKENQQMKKTLLDSRLTADLHGWPIPCSVSPGQPSGAPDETTSSTQHQPQSSGPALFTSHQSPGLQRRSVFKSDSDQPNNSSDEKHKHGLDFYC